MFARFVRPVVVGFDAVSPVRVSSDRRASGVFLAAGALASVTAVVPRVRFRAEPVARDTRVCGPRRVLAS